MTDPRLSTVFDYSDLRLHPDGTRVYQKTSNRRPVLAKVTVQDARANWIATDAGGSARIGKYRKGKPKGTAGDSDAEEIDIERELNEGAGITKFRDDGVEGHSSGGEGSETSQVPKKRTATKLPDQRKYKRRKFEAADEYLVSNEPFVTSATRDATEQVKLADNIFPTEPSPDLLKVIHRFASEFYTERGQLLNISREYRKERKQRALERKIKGSSGGPSNKKLYTLRSRSQASDFASEVSQGIFAEDENVKVDRKGKGKERNSDRRTSSKDLVQDGNEDADEEEDEQNEDDQEYQDEGDDIESHSSHSVKKNTKRRRPKSSGSEINLPAVYTDMYKVFEGSAMMALGMLVQEHIASLLNPDIPEGWSEEVKRVYTEDPSLNDDDDDEEEEEEEEGVDQLQGDEEFLDLEYVEEEGELEDEEDDLEEPGHEEQMQNEDTREDRETNDDVDDQAALLGDEDEDEGNSDRVNDENTAEDRPEHGNENERHDNPYLAPASTQQPHFHREFSFTFDERGVVKFPLVEDDDPIQSASDESMHSEDTVHSDSENELS